MLEGKVLILHEKDPGRSSSRRLAWLLNEDLAGTDGRDMAKDVREAGDEAAGRELAARVERIFAVVVEQLRQDPAFARRVRHALDPPRPPAPAGGAQAESPAGPPARAPRPPTPTPPSSPRTPPSTGAKPPPAAVTPAVPAAAPRRKALVDPFAIYDSGWEPLLRAHLARLTPDQLRDVIHQYRLDATQGLSGQEGADALRDWIVRAVEDLGLNR